MMDTDVVRRLERAVAVLPQSYRGPAGVVGVVKDGEVVVRHAWGFADLHARRPLATDTLLPICSITKQFTTGLLLSLGADISCFDTALTRWIPDVEGPVPAVRDLCNNQSGLRDYWALTVLCGAAPEGVFTLDDAWRLIKGSRSLQFAPGEQYSYCNSNFRILGALIEEREGRGLAELYAERLFAPAGMETATYLPDTASGPGAAVGYEGNPDFGFIPAINRIQWGSDAGICASLDDMIAWELFIDAHRNEAEGLYNRLSTPQAFRDGEPASYGFGLAHTERAGIKLTGHGGRLRGWRSHRLHAASERLSIVVIFNHEADAQSAALSIFDAIVGMPASRDDTCEDPEPWAGFWHEPESDLVLEVLEPAAGGLLARFAVAREMLAANGRGEAVGKLMTLQRNDETLRLSRSGDHLSRLLTPLAGPAQADIEGVFHSTELDSDFTCTSAGGSMFAAFSGFLGEGPMQPLYPVAPDIWLMPCQRSMDAPAPGDWTVHFHRDAGARVAGVSIGCWLARRNLFARAA